MAADAAGGEQQLAFHDDGPPLHGSKIAMMLSERFGAYIIRKDNT
jgi:hypothetical protein